MAGRGVGTGTAIELDVGEDGSEEKATTDAGCDVGFWEDVVVLELADGDVGRIVTKFEGVDEPWG